VFDIGSKNDASRFGVVSLGNKKRISAFVEKPKIQNQPLLATCLYYFAAERLRF